MILIFFSKTWTRDLLIFFKILKNPKLKVINKIKEPHKTGLNSLWIFCFPFWDLFIYLFSYLFFESIKSVSPFLFQPPFVPHLTNIYSLI
jgi:hypothetical protein